MGTSSMPMPEINGRELLDEWRRLLDAAIGSANAVAARTDLPKDVVKATQRQLELVQEIVGRERILAARILGPIDAIFDLLEETGVTLRRQAEALEAAGAALEETARLMKKQSERFERTVGVLRTPTDIARAAAGAKRAPRRAAPGAAAKTARKPASPTTRKAAAKPARKTAR